MVIYTASMHDNTEPTFGSKIQFESPPKKKKLAFWGTAKLNWLFRRF